MSRQRGFYHKCHRCLFRGKAADFVFHKPHSNGVAKSPAAIATDEPQSDVDLPESPR